MKKGAVEIVPGLWLGNKSAATNEAFLQQNRISAVINVGAGKCSVPGTTYLKIAMKDTPNADILGAVALASDFIRENEKKAVMIHCMGCIHRSPAVMIGILMRVHGKSFDEARTLVLERRPAARIRAEWEKMLREEGTRDDLEEHRSCGEKSVC